MNVIDVSIGENDLLVEASGGFEPRDSIIQVADHNNVLIVQGDTIHYDLSPGNYLLNDTVMPELEFGDDGIGEIHLYAYPNKLSFEEDSVAGEEEIQLAEDFGGSLDFTYSINATLKLVDFGKFLSIGLDGYDGFMGPVTILTRSQLLEIITGVIGCELANSLLDQDFFADLYVNKDANLNEYMNYMAHLSVTVSMALEELGFESDVEIDNLVAEY